MNSEKQQALLQECITCGNAVRDHSLIIELAIEDFELLDEEYPLSKRKEFRRAIAMLRQSASQLDCLGEEISISASRLKDPKEPKKIPKFLHFELLDDDDL